MAALSATAASPSGQLRPGVVTGNEYRYLVDACKRGGYALPAVNVTGTNTVNAALEAAAEHGSDIIIQLSNGGAQFFAGFGLSDSFEARVLGAVSAAQHVHLVAEHYGVCAVLHTDHANRALVPWVDRMLDCGEQHYERTGRPLFSSHMLDLSEETLDDNLSESARVLARAAALDMSLEIELGVTGGEEDGVGSDVDDPTDPRLYTQPDDVLAAYKRLAPIGMFSVAASFGNVHGVYKPGNVKLRPDILRQSQELVAQAMGTEPNPLHLVFHGGSGSDPADIAQAIEYGVFKMNIDTDTQFALARGVGTYVEAYSRAFTYQLDPVDGTPYKTQYDPRKWLRHGERAMAERLGQAFRELGSAGRSLAR